MSLGCVVRGELRILQRWSSQQRCRNCHGSDYLELCPEPLGPTVWVGHDLADRSEAQIWRPHPGQSKLRCAQIVGPSVLWTALCASTSLCAGMHNKDAEAQLLAADPESMTFTVMFLGIRKDEPYKANLYLWAPFTMGHLLGDGINRDLSTQLLSTMELKVVILPYTRITTTTTTASGFGFGELIGWGL